MTSKGYKYEEFGMTEEESNEAWDHISTMQSDINEKSTGEQLREVFEDSIFSLGQKMYIAYIFGRTEDRIRELRKIEHESN